MYGQIHCVIRELVQTKFGEETWEIILRKSKLDQHNSFLMFTRYDDASTIGLVGAVSDTLGVPVETVLEIFGEFFFDYCLRHGYDKMLRTLGSDIKSFIQNLDSLHSLLALSYKGISAPSFRCEDGENGDLILHYYSGRPGLYPIVKGVVKAVARDLFHQSVEMSIIEQNKEDIGCNQSQEHTAFRVQLRTEDTKTKGRPSPEGSSCDLRALTEFNPEKVLLKATDFCAAFPYHIIFDRNLRIRQCGDLVRKHSRVPVQDGMPLTKAFSIVHPKMVLSIENIRKFINAVFLMAISPGENGKKTMILKGQMIWLADTQNMIFIGSPRLTSLNELIEMNVYLADIPLYDVTRELVLLNQQRIAEIDIAKKLDETTAELKKTSQALEVEKSKTETLLHQMLPRKVAKALTHGQKVEAEKFDQVTILFSDIVTFTNIAAACSPLDIVNMLNEMYQRFDARTSEHNVYKVETIGDAYMIVSGVPEKTTIHAQPVANFAMDMIEDAGLVRSPATGLPLQIRVGVHTGPVVAGVVGVKMPRYCLFGDTVNTASRMESHGVPGRIHLSPTVYQAIRGWGYAFKRRGQMEVKGKGLMSTYFLCGHMNRRLQDPEDDFTDLEIHEDSTENGCHVERSRSSCDNLGELGLEEDQQNGGSEGDFSGISDGEGEERTDGDGERPKFYSSSASDNSPEKTPVSQNGRHAPNDKKDGQVDRMRKSAYSGSSQSLPRPESRGKLVRNKKISRTSDDGGRFQQGTRTDSDSAVNTTTTIVLTSSSTTTSLQDANSASTDCVYINGSFKNSYSQKSPGGKSLNDSGKRPNPSTDEDPIKHGPQSPHKNSDAQNHTKGEGGDQKESDRTHINHKISDNCDKDDTFDTQNNSEQFLTVDSSAGQNPSPTLSVSSSLTSLQSGRSMARSETFPISPVNKTTHKPPASASQGDLQNISDTKGKRRKRHNSKMCMVS